MSDVLTAPLDLGADAADLASAVRRWLERDCPPDVVRAALTDRSADASWRPPLRHGAVRLGLPGLAVPEAYGGSGAGVVELAAVAEQLGRTLCPVPHLSSAVLATLSLVLAAGDAAGPLLAELASGGRTAALAGGAEAWTSPLLATRDDHGWTLDGTAPAVLDAATADHLLAIAGTPHGPGLFLVDGTAADRTEGGEVPIDLTLDLAPVVLRHAPARPLAVPGPGDRDDPDGVAQRLRTAHQLAALVLAAEQAGGAARVLEMTVDHARTRHQFGRAIGSFQAVKHRCADLLMTLESLRSVVRDGLLRCARVLDGGPVDHDAVALAADLARSVAADGYLRIAAAAIQLHGGIGFTWEHDVHLYLKRARATQLLLGGPGRSRERLLPLVLADAARAASGPGAEAGEPSSATAVPPEVAAFLERHPVASTPDRDLRAARYDAGLTGPGEVEAAFLAAGAQDWSGRNVIGLGMAMATIRAHGTAEQREAYLRPCFTGEHIWCQLFSEPGAGSDLAGLATRAVADGDDFVVTGQKVWTSLGHVADYGLLLARTDPDVPKHQGLTYFLLDMRLPGIEVRPLRQLTGEAEFNEVRLDGVRVSRSAVLGEVGDGWRVAMTTLMNERVAIGGSRAARHGGPIAAALASYRRAVARGVAGPVEGDRLVRLWSAAEAARLTSERAASGGGAPGPQGSIAKLQMAEGNQAIYDFCVELAAAEGLYVDHYDQGESTTSAVFRTADPRKAWLRSLANSIEGGTSEVLRNILGERVLGLPGEPRVDRDLPWNRTRRA